MSSDSDLNAEVLQLVADSRLTGYLAVASLCILIYDHLACVPEEVELIWKSRWGAAKVIYLWNRYFSLIAVQASSSTVLIATVDFVLMLRVWILYGRETWMVWFFASLGIAEIVTMTIVDVFAFRQMQEYVHLGSIIKGCYAYNVPRFLTLYAAAPLVVTFIMFAMTLYKCGLTLYRMDRHVMPIWRLFLRDGVMWFLLVFAAGGSELLIWTMRRETLKQVLLVPALVVYSAVASRSLLNIKAIMAREPAEPEVGEISALQPITFASV